VDRFEVRPGEGIGPITIGMTRSEALEAAASAGLSAMSIVKSPTAPEALVIERQLFAYFDPDDRVEEVEVAVPRDQDDRGVMWNDLDFALDPGAVTGALDEIAKPDREDAEYPATSCYPDLGLALWKDAKPNDWLDGPFESVLVRRGGPQPAPPTPAEMNELLERLGLKPL
jgi:hypothetical protein